MASFFCYMLILSLLAFAVQGQLSSDERFYQHSCPSLHGIVRSTMARAVSKEPRMGASILRLFFHDCFVNGCDASVLLDDTPTFIGEKNAFPNQNSIRGFQVIDAIKTRAEQFCSATVSCADILALAARDAVLLLGGPEWIVQLGRRDATTASQSAANSQLPPPLADLSTLISMFAAKGLTASEMTALSGGHTIGKSQCAGFRTHIYNETNIDPSFASQVKKNCPLTGGNSNLSPLDKQSENVFNNDYYKNLVARQGLLHSDQELFNGGSQDSLVQTYSDNPFAFANDFAAAMVKMGALSPLTGNNGEIRLNCSVVN